MNQLGEVAHESSRHRFTLPVGEQKAMLLYHLEPGRISLIHTEVPSQAQDLGVGGKLTHAALEYARENHLLVVPHCPFVAAYLRRHPEFHDLVDHHAE